MENYKKKYKEALERANIIYTGKYKPEIEAWTKKSLEAIFPELAESEEEKPDSAAFISVLRVFVASVIWLICL